MVLPVTIRDVRTIAAQPAGFRLVVMNIFTSEPGLNSPGCAAFTRRFHAVQAAIDKHLRPFFLGRDVSRIEEILQLSMVNGYQRNGPVPYNAVPEADMALQDIKVKQAECLSTRSSDGSTRKRHGNKEDTEKR